MSRAARTLALRKRVGLAGGLLMAVALVVSLDGLTSGLRVERDVFRCLAGQEMPISANVPMYVDSPDKVYVQSAPSGVRLRVDQVMPGYMMGGRLFAGAVETEPGLAAGNHSLVLSFPPDDTGKVNTLSYTVRVYPSAAAMRATSPYFTERLAGVTAYPLAAGLAGLGLACFGLVFLLSMSLERQLAGEGIAEVFKFKRLPEGLELEFGLGRRHGLAPGAEVELLGSDMRALGPATVTEVRESASVATAGPLEGASPECFVSLGGTHC
ncbi:hypothetical protein [Desulfovibrio sp.]